MDRAITKAHASLKSVSRTATKVYRRRCGMYCNVPNSLGWPFEVLGSREPQGVFSVRYSEPTICGSQEWASPCPGTLETVKKLLQSCGQTKANAERYVIRTAFRSATSRATTVS